MEKVKVVRSGLGQQIRHVESTYDKIRRLEIRKRKMGEMLEYMHAMRELYEFKKQSEGYKNKNKIEFTEK